MRRERYVGQRPRSPAVPTYRRRPLDEPRAERARAPLPAEPLPLFFALRPAADFLEVLPAFRAPDAARRAALRPPLRAPLRAPRAPADDAVFFRATFRAPPALDAAVFRELRPPAVPPDRLAALFRDDPRAPALFAAAFRPAGFPLPLRVEALRVEVAPREDASAVLPAGRASGARDVDVPPLRGDSAIPEAASARAPAPAVSAEGFASWSSNKLLPVAPKADPESRGVVAPMSARSRFAFVEPFGLPRLPRGAPPPKRSASSSSSSSTSSVSAVSAVSSSSSSTSSALSQRRSL